MLKCVNFLTQEHINQCIEEQVMRVVQRVKIEKKNFRMQLLKSKPHHYAKINGIKKHLKTCTGGNFIVYPLHIVDTQHQITGEAYEGHYQQTLKSTLH